MCKQPDPRSRSLTGIRSGAPAPSVHNGTPAHACAGSAYDLGPPKPLPLSPAARSLVPLSPEALLRHVHVWGQGLCSLVCARSTPPGLLAPALALLLQVSEW